MEERKGQREDVGKIVVYGINYTCNGVDCPNDKSNCARHALALLNDTGWFAVNRSTVERYDNLCKQDHMSWIDKFIPISDVHWARLGEAIDNTQPTSAAG